MTNPEKTPKKASRATREAEKHHRSDLDPASAAAIAGGGRKKGEALRPIAVTPGMSSFREMVYFAFRNRKLVIGLSIVLFFLLLAIVGPYLAQHTPGEFSGPQNSGPTLKGGFYLGTTSNGQDIFAQFISGLRNAFAIGLLGGAIASVIAMLVGFVAGYRAGIVDEVLSMVTNIILCIPVFALLLVVAAFWQMKSIYPEGFLVGIISWPWAARALRAQTFSLTAREFVSLARLSGERTFKIIFKEIAPNMSSYLFMMFILLFGGAILIAATLDFLGLGPGGTVTLGRMMNVSAIQNSAIYYGFWWWFIPPGLAISLLVGGAYFMNVGLDEVFNPRLREM
jgi:peptide/nickel transport system permease protein